MMRRERGQQKLQKAVLHLITFYVSNALGKDTPVVSVAVGMKELAGDLRKWAQQLEEWGRTPEEKG